MMMLMHHAHTLSVKKNKYFKDYIVIYIYSYFFDKKHKKKASLQGKMGKMKYICVF